MNPINYSWLFILLGYSNSLPENTGNVPYKPTHIYSRAGNSLKTVATASSKDEDSWKSLLHRFGVGMQSALDKYCKNTYDPREVETLLDIGK